mgnify:CR=1 FL=1
MNLHFGLAINFLISAIALSVFSSRFSGIKTLTVPVCKMTMSHFFSAILISVSVFSPFSFLKRYQLFIIYTCTVLTLCTLYAVQPIQPLFEKEFELSRFEAVIFTTAIMLPLGFAPIFYGYILETFSSKRFLKNAVLLLGLLELLFAYTDTYFFLLSIRGLQGLLIPAVLTSLMSYISFITPKEKVQQAIGYYIGATIFGGFIGRLLSGFLSDLFGWRLFFVLLGIALIVMFFCLEYLSEEVKVDFVKPKFSQIMDILKKERQ